MRLSVHRPGLVPTGVIGLIVTLLASIVLLAAAFLVPLSVRSGAPFGTEQTVDYDRGIAVLGARITPNYDGFDGLGLDLRGYSSPVAGDRFDFIVSIRDIEADRIVRSIAVSVEADSIPAGKPPFSDILTDVQFDPIPDSAGIEYYIDVERGPRNADDVVTLWGVRAYSSLTAVEVVEAAVAEYDLGYSPRTTAWLLIGLTLLSLTSSAGLIGAVTAAAVGKARQR